MSRTHKVKANETWDIISRKVYGTEDFSSNLRSANPDQSDPVAPFVGVVVIVPDLPNSPNSESSAPQVISSESNDQVTLLIDGESFSDWLTVDITRSVDSLSTVSFTAPFEFDLPDFREMFVPLSFKPINVYVGGTRIFRGVMVDISPKIGVDSKTINVSCYSNPGVLNDCTMPASAYPIQYISQNLGQIAEVVCKPFGIGVDFLDNVSVPSSALDETSITVSSKVFSYLSGLAKQRGFILSDTSDGKLLIHKGADDAPPVAKLVQGSPTLLSVDSKINPQGFYTHFTGIAQPLEGLKPAPSHTEKNIDIAPGVFRPFTYNIKSAVAGETIGQVQSEYGRVLGNAVSYTIKVPGWRTPDGELWSVNTFVELTAPDAMIYNPYKFLIRRLQFTKDANQTSTTLHLVMPGVFSGAVAYTLPWS